MSTKPRKTPAVFYDPKLNELRVFLWVRDADIAHFLPNLVKIGNL